MEGTTGEGFFVHHSCPNIKHVKPNSMQVSTLISKLEVLTKFLKIISSQIYYYFVNQSENSKIISFDCIYTYVSLFSRGIRFLYEI